MGNQAILSLSPERFIQAYPENGQIKAQTKPIKGTVLRGKTVEEDQENAIQLLNSDKDRAENLMIVDLLRNDLGKSCIAGSIQVPKLFDLESFPNVHHLVSTVTGELKPDCTPLDLLQGCFPGGSITGAPKKRSMEIIDELEPIQRSSIAAVWAIFVPLTKWIPILRFARSLLRIQWFIVGAAAELLPTQMLTVSLKNL